MPKDFYFLLCRFFSSNGSGTSPDGHLVETVELPGRDFHLGAQFHPEFKSRPNRAHPLFKGFIAAALRYRAAAVSYTHLDVYKRQAIDSNGAVGHLLTRSAVFVKVYLKTKKMTNISQAQAGSVSYTHLHLVVVVGAEGP